MNRRILLTFFCLFVIGSCPGLAQSGVNLTDPSAKLPYISGRAPQNTTQVPDPSSSIQHPVSSIQHSASSIQHPASRHAWWHEARFGMFIHWGLYAVPAGEWNGSTGYGEWIRSLAKIPLEVYDQFVPKFNPEGFNAEAWVKMARDAGMKYIVITSKHHDGFCLFDTKQTGFNIMNTPFKRDPMKELAAACKLYGLKFCFYYSIMDWHHPDYLPRRDWETDRPAKGADFDRYVAYMKAQLNELLSNYGDIGVLWFDGEWENTWNERYGKEIYQYVRSLQPEILVNNRVGAGRLDMEGLTKAGAFGGDFGTPEQQIPATGLPGVDWETCMTMNDHWGYNRMNKNYKSGKDLIRMLADIASKGGNYLLNVGPTAEGLIPPESVERLGIIGNWMKVNGESVHGTEASPFKQLNWGRCTQKMTAAGAVLYLHIFDWPPDGSLELNGVLNTPENAFLLTVSGKVPLQVKRVNDALIIALPPRAPDSINSVVTVHLQGKLDITDPPDFTTEFNTFVDSLEIGLVSDRDQVEIRYDFGDSAPGSASPRFTAPFSIRTSTTLSARCFRNGSPVSGTVTRLFTKAEPLKSLSMQKNNVIKPGLRYRYFEGEYDSLPDFNALRPVKEGVVADFVFAPRNEEERFCFEYNGLVEVPESSVYIFYTGSDDGSRLWIDGRLVVDNDGLHGMKEKQGSIALEKGCHEIRVGFFERTGSDILEVSVQSQTLAKQTLPSQWLYHEK